MSKSLTHVIRSLIAWISVAGLAGGAFYGVRYIPINDQIILFVQMMVGMFGVACVVVALHTAYKELPPHVSRTRFAFLVDPPKVVTVLSAMAAGVLLAETRGGGISKLLNPTSFLTYLFLGWILSAIIGTVSASLSGHYLKGNETSSTDVSAYERHLFSAQIAIIVMAIGWLFTQYLKLGDLGEFDDF